MTGEGTISTHAPVISSKKCGDKCDADSDCNTYEYEPKMRKCGLNKEEYPDVANNASEFIFCAKGLFNQKHLDILIDCYEKTQFTPSTQMQSWIPTNYWTYCGYGNNKYNTKDEL